MVGFMLNFLKDPLLTGGIMPEELKENKEEQEEKTPESLEEAEKTGKKKHERLKQEFVEESKFKEKFKDFRKGMAQKGKHQYDRMRKDKFIGGTKGRRGG
jgi:hypothetical protein